MPKVCFIHLLSESLSITGTTFRGYSMQRDFQVMTCIQVMTCMHHFEYGALHVIERHRKLF